MHVWASRFGRSNLQIELADLHGTYRGNDQSPEVFVRISGLALNKPIKFPTTGSSRLLR